MRRILIGGLPAFVAGALGMASCPVSPTTPDVPPTITGAAVSGTLVQGRATTITASATVVDTDGTVVGVTVDLSAIGGQQAQPLTLGQNNLWSFSGTVTPPAAGQQAVIFLATDNAGLTSTATVTVTVATPAGGTTPPIITNAAVTGTLTVNQTSTVTVSATVSSVSSTITAVAADLTAIGGFSATPMVQTTNNVWTFSGPVNPSAAGTQSVVITAADSLGNTSTAAPTIVVNNSFITSPIPPT